MESLAGRTVAVLGLGASGVAAARLALEKEGDVYVSDTRSDAATAARGADLRVAGASVELGGHDLDRVARADLVVVSPGIPPDAPVLRGLAERGVGWISEPELAARFHRGSLIAVTGTNGKTTVTLLTEHLLRHAGVRAAAGGNVGGGLAPAASELALVDEPYDWWVLEMSSFQLAAVDRFRPDIGVVTNLSPDHLDRYQTVEAYYADKARLFDNADEESRWVLPADDEAVTELAGAAPGRRFHFGDVAGASAYVAGEHLALAVEGLDEPLCRVADLPLLGRHNVRNALAASLAARLAGASTEAIAEGLTTVRPLPHRVEPVGEIDGVLWVNDSKATNVAATVGALESLERPVVLLLGGKDKGEELRSLVGAARGRAHSVLAFGAAAGRIAEAFRAAEREAVARTTGGGSTADAGSAPAGGGSRRMPDIPALEQIDGDLENVVRRAAELARPGDVVLLSPACSSFDMFESYEERGRRFVELVRGLP